MLVDVRQRSLTIKGQEILTADPQASKPSYLDVLGMSKNLQRSHAPGFVYLQSDKGDLTLATAQGDGWAEPSRTMELGFEVNDLPALQARLEEQKVAGFHVQSMGWGDVLEGHDLDGYRVIIYCFKRE